MPTTELSKLNVLICGTGEYTTGWTGSGASKSDKKVNMFLDPLLASLCSTSEGAERYGDLTLRFALLNLFILLVDRLSFAGVRGGKFPAIRQHFSENIGAVYRDMDLSFEEFPKNGETNSESYKGAIDQLSPGDAVVIFTPDDTHYDIAMYAIERDMHVLITKPATKLLSDHVKLVNAAKQHNVVCFVEHHKRFDPVYSDARVRARALGEFNFFSAWMSQPKSQLETFRAWAGKSSDISYYLSSHHVDICCWILQDIAIPTRVVASAASGIATSEPYNCVPETEDTITLMVDWQSLKSTKHRGIGVYTASWTAPLKAGIHSAQHWYFMAEKGDITIDQAHRGYETTVDDDGKAWYNPFYMKYSPSETGHFDGQRGYGYISIEKFVDAAQSVNTGLSQPCEYDKQGLPTISNTILTTAILNAGRISLDEQRPVEIKKEEDEWVLL
ncbi:hypothetical protein APHAL10511_006249 [Amanita phalloides]|nr:hypothetical protein APHAL10511_006249 [Amanita phalloides]